MINSRVLLPQRPVLPLQLLQHLLGRLSRLVIVGHSALEVLAEVGVGLQMARVGLVGVAEVYPGIEEEFVLEVDFLAPSPA